MTTTRVRDNVLCVTLTASHVKKAVKSYAMSKRYINTMLRATIINIMYHRLNIDKKEFLTKNFNNIPYKTFRSKSNNMLIREFHTYMLACKDALDKNYLREFYLYFINMLTGEIIENYKFTFNYGEVDEPIEVQKEQSLVDSTCELLRILNDLGLQNKPDLEIQIKVEFTYFDDTPEDYEPPGFRSINETDSLIKKMGKSGNAVILGTLFTGFHMLKCRGRGKVFEFNQSPHTTPEEVNAVAVDKAGTNCEQEGVTQCSTRVAINSPLMTEDMTCYTDSAPVEINRVKSGFVDKTNLNINDTYMSDCIIELSEDSEHTQMECPCKFPAVDGFEVDRILCLICKRVYHAPCQGYLDKTFIGEQAGFTCSYCSGDDAIVAAVDAKQSVVLFRVRHLIGIMYKHGELPSSFKNDFRESLKHIESLNIFPVHGKQDHFDISTLDTLFSFYYKLPDMSKLRKITF